MQEKHCIYYHYIYACWFIRREKKEEKEVSESVDVFKTSLMSILCLKERNNMETNKSFIKLIAMISLSFP